MNAEHDPISNDKDFGDIDLPLVALQCFSGGVLVVGVCNATLMFLILSITDLQLKWNCILSGITNLGVAFIVYILASLYWWCVTRKTGAMMKTIFLLAPLLRLLAFVSGIFVGVMITYAIIG
jgi:hypothetical protein